MKEGKQMMGIEKKKENGREEKVKEKKQKREERKKGQRKVHCFLPSQ